ncbi:MAG: S26 family signal peptidase [Dysgonamonadaceae bacterium]|jgi:signal peptidase I|nr:S26 family signal peptidase [Dysgonamonadaceae bacterium]
MKRATKAQWIKFGIVTLLYVLFTVWTKNYWLLLGIPVLFDIYISKILPWGAWKKTENKHVRKLAEWVDAIFFALIAVYLINLFIFQNYKIPTSSLEKTLLVGDYLFVSKLSYGPRVPNTPLSFPLSQHTLPILNCKSYIEWPQWPYHRLKGFGHVKRYDIVVFNFPTGDTVALRQQNPDYYQLCDLYGRDRVNSDKATFGEIVYRPVDRRENYVKRCVGMPGDSLQIIDNKVYIDGKPLPDPKNMQLNYFVETTGKLFSDKQFRTLNVSKEDQMLVNGMANSELAFELLGIHPDSTGAYNPVYKIPLTQEALNKIRNSGWAKTTVVEPDAFGGDYFYPGKRYQTGWSRDNFGPLWIPKKGATVELDEKNLALYSRCIVNYEGNRMHIKDGAVFINDAPASTYTFKYDYYFMMGDNRHNSLDSRSWGFVPEDHVVGSPILVWLSTDKDRGFFDGGIRWKRLFRLVKNE